jgi:hypothetical protein
VYVCMCCVCCGERERERLVGKKKHPASIFDPQARRARDQELTKGLKVDSLLVGERKNIGNVVKLNLSLRKVVDLLHVIGFASMRESELELPLIFAYEFDLPKREREREREYTAKEHTHHTKERYERDTTHTHTYTTNHQRASIDKSSREPNKQHTCEMDG